MIMKDEFEDFWADITELEKTKAPDTFEIPLVFRNFEMGAEGFLI